MKTRLLYDTYLRKQATIILNVSWYQSSPGGIIMIALGGDGWEKPLTFIS